MADYNSVPLGQAGTGAAFILPESQAANRAIDTIDYNQQVKQREAMLAQQQAEAIARSYQTNALKAKAGKLWDAELRELNQKHIDQAIKYRQQGFDIYNPNPNDPNQLKAHEQYMTDRARLENMYGVRTNLENQFKAQDAILSKAAPGEYDETSINLFHQLPNTKLQDIIDNNIEIPFPKKAFNEARLIDDKLDPVTFEESKVVNGMKTDIKKMMKEPTKEMVISRIKSAQGGEEYLKKKTGLTFSEAGNIPDTLDENVKALSERYAGDPKFREELAKQGITPINVAPVIQQMAQEDFAKKQKYNQFIDQKMGIALAKANEFAKSNPDFSVEKNERDKEKLRLMHQRENRIASGGGGNDAATYRQDLLTRMFSGVPQSGEEVTATLKGKGAFEGRKVQYIQYPDGFGMKIAGVPEIKDEQGTVVQTATQPILKRFKNDKNGVVEANTFISEVTGENIPTSALLTVGGKKKVPGGFGSDSINAKPEPKKAVQKVIKSSDIASKARAAGYSVAEYKALLIKNGVKIQ